MVWGDVPIRSRQLVEEAPGWCPSDQLTALFGLAYEVGHLDGDIVEIGTWCGRSAAALGLAAERHPSTTVYCADLFPERADWRENPDGTYSFAVDIDGTRYHGCNMQTVWPDAYGQIELTYARIGSPHLAFETLIRTLGLDNVVRALRGNSSHLMASLPVAFTCKLAYIDGEHSYEAVKRDILSVEPFLTDGGWLCFDDAFSGYTGVDRALYELVVGRDGYGDFQQLTRKLFVARKHFTPSERIGDRH